MPTSATDIISLQRLRLAVDITETTDAELNLQLTSYIESGVDRVSREIGWPLLNREVSVDVWPESSEQIMKVDLPDFDRWTGYSYVAGDSDIYSGATTGTWANVDAVGYPPTLAASVAARDERTRSLTVYPNGLSSETKAWPALHPDVPLTLTAATELPLGPELTPAQVTAGETRFEKKYAALALAVEMAARAAWNGDRDIRFRDAVSRLLKPYRQWYHPDA